MPGAPQPLMGGAAPVEGLGRGPGGPQWECVGDGQGFPRSERASPGCAPPDVSDEKPSVQGGRLETCASKEEL